MREIKFMAWDAKNKKMIGPFCVGSVLSECWPPEMQYTGLKDKDGKEIYEGDIVDFGTWEDGGERAVIEYDEKLACFIYQFFSHYGGEGYGIIGEQPYRELLTKIEIIGNIYENPDKFSLSGWLPGDKRKCEKEDCIREADHGGTTKDGYKYLCETHWNEISEKANEGINIKMV